MYTGCEIEDGNVEKASEVKGLCIYILLHMLSVLFQLAAAALVPWYARWWSWFQRGGGDFWCFQFQLLYSHNLGMSDKIIIFWYNFIIAEQVTDRLNSYNYTAAWGEKRIRNYMLTWENVEKPTVTHLLHGHKKWKEQGLDELKDFRKFDQRNLLE